MSEILTVHGGMIQGQDHINDNTDQVYVIDVDGDEEYTCLLYTSPSPRDS